jgi:hypothetical protein
MKGMKSHDYHVMMEEILPLCMRNFMEKGCRQAIIHLSHVFKKLCAKVVDLATMGNLKQDVAFNIGLVRVGIPSLFL